MMRLPFRATSLSSTYESLDKLPVAVLLDNVRSMYNVGSFFRTMDAAGAGPLCLAGITAHPPHTGIRKTALGAEETVEWKHALSPLLLLDEMRQRGHQIAAIETSSHSVDLFEWQPAFPVCIVFGHEVDGIQPAVAEACDVHVRIPMLGRKHSLNVATAGGVVLFEMLRKYLELRRPGGKTPQGA
jgi:23S rRNA (guanosine2251-2'-O)-methyltransferase